MAPEYLPATQTHSLTVQGDHKDQAEEITLWEYLRRATERNSCQAAEEERQQSPFWDSKVAIPLPGTGPFRYKSSPPPQSKPATPPASVCSTVVTSHPRLQRRQPPPSFLRAFLLVRDAVGAPLLFGTRPHLPVTPGERGGCGLGLKSSQGLMHMLSILQASLLLLHGFCLVWLQLEQPTLTPVAWMALYIWPKKPRTMNLCFEEFLREGLIDAPAPVSAGGPPASLITTPVPASMSAGLHGSSADLHGSSTDPQGTPAASGGSPAASQGSPAASLEPSADFLDFPGLRRVSAPLPRVSAVPAPLPRVTVGLSLLHLSQLSSFQSPCQLSRFQNPSIPSKFQGSERGSRMNRLPSKFLCSERGSGLNRLPSKFPSFKRGSGKNRL
ncbi:hypothetical protein CRENBAI_012204 [Crenichthys baileyi]|uniref:Uncharacterized protein n=1 Tax=Crenichthys baileyi TaxID=28760 RepID=A0AAV9S5S5_9TELE